MTITLTASNATAQNAESLSYPPTPPVARKVLKETRINGDVLKDEYFWLREKSNPDVKAYLDAENTYTDSIMAPTKPFQDALYQELVSHVKETDAAVPYQEGGYFYYTRTEQGKQYPIFCRKKGSLDAPEEIVIDQNELAKGEKFMGIGAFLPSDDGNFLAYSTDNTGFRQYALHIKDLHAGKTGTENIPRTTSVAWSNDNKTLFYSVEDEQTKRSYRVYRHVVGNDSAQDALVNEEKDEALNVGVGKSRSGKFIFMELSSLTTSEIRYLDASQPTGEWKLIAPRVAGEEYYADHRGDKFYIRSNHGGRNFELFSAPVSDPQRKNWKIVIPHRQDVMIEDIEPFADFLVLVERAHGLRQLRIHDFHKGEQFTEDELVKFPEQTYTAGPQNNRIWATTTLRYNYQSPITPSSVFDYDMEKHESKLMKELEIPGGFDRSNYELVRIFAPAKDGVRVPVTVFYRKGVKRDGSAPLYLYAYGSYGYPLPVNFSSSRLALLDRGVVIALAHIRGGGDLGKPWHDDGRLMRKMNTFNDFIASAEYLIAQKYCDKEKIAIEGGSAGGLLMGAVTNLRPDLWKAVLSKVPFVDVMNTMLDASLPLTVGEYEEWGNPNKKEDYTYMKQYSPYDNLAAKKYPALLVKTSFNDSQVMYWEPAKYVAKLRTLKPQGDHNVLMLKTNMAGGHGGSSGRYDFLHDTAFDYAFLLTQLGVTK